MAQSADVFFSYSRDDKDRVLDLAAKLRAAGVASGSTRAASTAPPCGASNRQCPRRRQGPAADGQPAAVRSHNVAKEVMLTSERKGHILPVHLEPTTIPPA